MSVHIYGASDDLVEIDGDIVEEFAWYPDDSDEKRLLAFSDGTVLRIWYDDEGMWRIQQIAKGTAKYEHKAATDPDDDYSDHVNLTGKIDWVVFGEEWARKRAK